MTQEEKAKAYDKALKYAHYLINERCKESTDGAFHRANLEIMFPELKESKGEKIRKALLEYFGEHCDMSDWNGIYGYEVVAWLEKQSKQMSDPRYSILDKLIEADDIYQMSVNDTMVEEAKNKAIEALSKLEISKLLGLEKKGEQKPYGSYRCLCGNDY